MNKCIKCGSYVEKFQAYSHEGLGPYCREHYMLVSGRIGVQGSGKLAFNPTLPPAVDLCEDCKGSGEYVGLLTTSKCKACGGSGKKTWVNPGTDLILGVDFNYPRLGRPA